MKEGKGGKCKCVGKVRKKKEVGKVKSKMETVTWNEGRGEGRNKGQKRGRERTGNVESRRRKTVKRDRRRRNEIGMG